MLIQFQGTTHEFPDGTPDEAIRKALMSYQRGAPESERPVRDMANDLAYAVAEGGGQVMKGVGTIAGMVVPGGTKDNWFTQMGEQSIQGANFHYSERGKRDAAAQQQRVAEATEKEGQWGGFKETVSGLATNPRLFAVEAAKQIPQLIPGVAAGGVARAAALVRGLEPTKKAIMGWVVGTGASQQSADVAGQVWDDAVKAGLPPETAKDRAIQAFMTSIPAALAAQFAFGPGGRSFERVLGGIEGRQMGAKAAVKALIGEPASETAEELSGQFITNVQAQKFDPSVELTRDFGSTAGQAAAMGVLYGGVGGAKETLSEPRRADTTPDVRQAIDALNRRHEDRVGTRLHEELLNEYEQTDRNQELLGETVWKDYIEETGGPQLELNFQGKKRKRKPKPGFESFKKGEQGQLNLAPAEGPAPKAAIVSINDVPTPTIPPALILGDDRKANIPVQAVTNWLRTSKEMLKHRPELAGMMSHVEEYLPAGLRVEVVSDAKIKRLFEQQGGKKGQPPPAGFYIAKGNTIYMAQGSLDAQTVSHELVHSASQYALERWVTYDTGTTDLKNADPSRASARTDAPQAVKNLVALYNGLSNEATGIDTSRYGFVDVSEFIAEAFSNPMFQEYLATRTFEGKSMWRKLVEYIADLLDIPTQNVDALSATLATGKQVMEYQQENLNYLQKYVDRVWPKAMHREIKDVVNKALDGDIAIEEHAADEKQMPMDLDTVRDAVFEDIGIDTGRIPDDPNVEDPGLIARILQDQDGSAKWDWMYPGALQAADIRNSQLIRTVYRLMDNATKRAKKFERDFINPLETIWSKLLRNRRSTMLLHGVFKSELRNGENFTDEDLRSVLSPEEIAAYKDMRDVLEMSWKAQNDALVAVGLKEVTRLDSYYAARWRGPWRSVIKNSDGKVVWVVAERSRAKAAAAIEWIKKRNPGLAFEEVRYHKPHDKENMLQAGYLELLKVLDMTDPDSQALHEAWKEAMLAGTENVMGQEKHFKKKSGVQGFAGDRPWADNYLDAKEFFIEQMKYMKAAAQWSAMQAPAKKVKDLIANEEIAKSQKNNVKYVKAYLRNHLGYSTAKWIDNLEIAVAEAFGRDTEVAENIMGGLKTLFYIAQLGYNIPYSIYAAIQPTLGAGKHAHLTSDGYHHNIGKTTALAFKDGLAFSMAHLGRWITHVSTKKPLQRFGETMDSMSRKLLSENGKIATAYIEANGVVDVTPTTDIMDLRVPAWVGKARDWGGWTISAVEIMSRSMAFYSFVHHLAQSDKRNLSTDDILIMADDATKDIMADYRPHERAIIFNKAGITGKGLATLQTFKFNWMAQTIKYYKLGMRTGQWRPFAMQMSVYFLMAGAAGFIGIDDMEDIWMYILKNTMGDAAFAKYRNYSPKLILTRNLGSLLSYGLVSGVTGTNIYTRGSLGDIIPFNPNKGVGENLLNFFPFLSTGANMAYGAVRGGMEAMGVGNRDENIAAIHRGMPAALKGPWEVQSGLYENNGVLSSLSDPSLGVYRRTDRDRWARMLGLRTLQEAQATEGRYRHREIKIETDKRRGKAGNDFWSAALRGDNRPAMEYLQKYVELGGDPRHLLTPSRMKEAQQRMLLDYFQQLALKVKPGNEAAVREFIDYILYYQPTDTEE